MKAQALQQVKYQATKIWFTYDDTHNYASEKIQRVKNAQTIQEVVQMFDPINQKKLFNTLSQENLELTLQECL